jgi:hypothetical protein
MTMKKIHAVFFFLTLLSLLGFEWPLPSFYSPSGPEILGTEKWVAREMTVLTPKAKNIDENVLRLSLSAYAKAKKEGVVNKEYLTVIDYTKPSSEKRLWVFDVKRGRTLFNTWVSHGKNSGALNAKSFSNNPGSLKSSIGVFVTDTQPYQGDHGYSLRLHGLEHGVNDNAYRRDIVIHGAWYVNNDVIRRYGAAGRSFGCPAVSDEVVKSIIDTIKQNTLIFAYYPDRSWLSHSHFLTA